MADFALGLAARKPAWRSPREIWEDTQLRMAELDASIPGGLPRGGEVQKCQTCHGKGFVGEGDSDDDRCTADGCRYGYVRHADVSRCPICHGAEVVGGPRGSEPCTCVGPDAVNFRRAIACGVPGTYATMTPAIWKAKFLSRGGNHLIAYETARDIAMGRPSQEPGLFLCGRAGLGKTTLAAALVVGAFAQGRRPVWISWSNFMDRLVEAQSRTDTSARDELSRVQGADMLIIDDFAVDELYSSFRSRTIHGILDVRRNRPTIITTNQDIGKIAENYGEPVASRIVDSCRLVQLEGPDQRILDAAQRRQATRR